VAELIGITKGTLQTFKNNLQNILMLQYCQNHEKRFYKLKDEVTSFINAMEECCILPAGELLEQNLVSKYRFIMYELCGRFHITNYRETMAELYDIYSENAPEEQLLGLWYFAGMLVNESRAMLTIADCRVAEIVPKS